MNTSSKKTATKTEQAANGSERYFSRAIGNALRVLELLQQSPTALALTEVSRQTKLPKRLGLPHPAHSRNRGLHSTAGRRAIFTRSRGGVHAEPTGKTSGGGVADVDEKPEPGVSRNHQPGFFIRKSHRGGGRYRQPAPGQHGKYGEEGLLLLTPVPWASASRRSSRMSGAKSYCGRSAWCGSPRARSSGKSP